MTLITKTSELADFCAQQKGQPFITVDTEFLRESTYWPKLCLVQLGGETEAVAVDVLAEGIDIAPLLDLMADESIVKVFHAGRQDMEIFHRLMEGDLPHPIFDTQVAGMVSGFGDQVSYERLVRDVLDEQVDKGSRFADWSRRPLTDRQLDYALADVTHLRDLYLHMKEMLEKTGRASWLEAEMDILTDPETYNSDPERAWMRIKSRSDNRRYLAALKELAAWREREVQARDIPRNRLLRDEQLLDIAVHRPDTVEALARTRGVSHDMARGKLGQGILEAIKRANALPKDALPSPPQRPVIPQGLGPVVELLKVLLKARCEAHDVAQKLVASSADLELIAADDQAEVPALKGWRREIFGADALKLKHGRLALTLEAQEVQVIER
ncbi:ribonuclease D [Limibacillus halophilus]|jgi:ribonuclease D